MKKLPVVTDTDLDRRQLMQLLAASAGLAGLGTLAGCMEKPKERILPRVEGVPELTPGLPVEYASALVLDGFATGVVVRTYEARPTKIEGNPDHPASLGATNAQHQAAVLELYDPARARGALDAEEPIDLATFLRAIGGRSGSPGLWFLLTPQSSPLVADLMGRIRARHPGARFAFHSPVDRSAVYEGARLAFGRALEAQYRFANADVVVSLDADFTAAMPNSVRWSHDFALRRRLANEQMSRLYIAEPRPTPTGSLADHRLPLRPTRVPVVARALYAAVRGDAPDVALTAAERRWVVAAAADLRARRGLVVVGDRQPAAVHALGHAINGAINAIGTTIAYTEPAVLEPLGDGLPQLIEALRAKRVETLVIVEANPAYSDPAIAPLLAGVRETICVGPLRHETARHCRWFVPLAHTLESWSDTRSYDGTLTLIQPVIRPLHASVSLVELLAAFAGDARPDAYGLLRAKYAPDPASEITWGLALRRGLVEGTEFPTVDAKPGAVPLPTTQPGDFDIAFDVSYAIYDGRFANNPWLQELPKPHEKLTWGNAAVIGPATARALRVETGDVVRIAHGGARIDIPVYVLPGHAEQCASIEIGYGRRFAGPVGSHVGVDVMPLLTERGFVTGAKIERTANHEVLAVTQQHFDQDGREIALAATLPAYQAEPFFTRDHWGPLPSLLTAWPPDSPPQWGMTIDTTICTGCSACVIACQAENNVPVVGKQGVINNREMHWLRIDTYREGEAVVHQPMLCQHCETAPCEYVCPVYATQHSPDGLNEMVYNRCIGTRFCSNNCPYKVRRFNYFDYTEDTPPQQRLQFNPNVTVRARGVMEKCTYCVQRIRAAEIEARKERRDIRPGEVVTACQQACPTNAIQFGSLHHTEMPVVQWREEPRHYAVLHHLGTQPRTVYLAKITNPNPELGDDSPRRKSH